MEKDYNFDPREEDAFQKKSHGITCKGSALTGLHSFFDFKTKDRRYSSNCCAVENWYRQRYKFLERSCSYLQGTLGITPDSVELDLKCPQNTIATAFNTDFIKHENEKQTSGKPIIGYRSYKLTCCKAHIPKD